MDKKYYIVSNKHTEGLVRTFWRANSNGYTINLEEAGIYTEEDTKSMSYPVLDIENIKTRGRYQTYFIAVDDVELIGKKMVCILN